jgi:hypothetical protein
MYKDKEKSIGNRLFRLWATIGQHILDGQRDPYLVAEALQKIVDECVVRVRATDGMATLEENHLWYLDFSEERDFGSSVPGSPTPPTRALVAKPDGGTFGEAFGRYGELENLAWQESQIVAFAEDWQPLFNNGEDSRNTYFLCKRGVGLCVVSIGTNENHVDKIHYVFLDDLDAEMPWGTYEEIQIVVPLPH